LALAGSRYRYASDLHWVSGEPSAAADPAIRPWPKPRRRANTKSVALRRMFMVMADGGRYGEAMKTIKRKTDDEYVFGNDVARDGESVRVLLYLMDSDETGVRLSSTRALHDGLGNAAGFRSGFVFSGDASPPRRDYDDARSKGRANRDKYIKDMGSGQACP
jgi:hypothetical protein